MSQSTASSHSQLTVLTTHVALTSWGILQLRPSPGEAVTGLFEMGTSEVILRQLTRDELHKADETDSTHHERK